MAKEVKLFEGAVATSRAIIDIGSKPVGFQWYKNISIQPLIESALPSVIDEVSHTLPYEGLSTIVPQIYSDGSFLQNTANAMFDHDGVTIYSINTMPIQMGRKAYILLNEIDTEHGKKEFISYISRSPVNSEKGDEAARDFSNLKTLHERAHERLTDEAKKKYSFIDPYALGEATTYNGHSYRGFSMPFVDGYGELRADVMSGKNGANTAYFRYAIPYTREMEDQNRRSENVARRLVNSPILDMRTISSSHQDLLLRKLMETEEAQIISKQKDDILVGNALLYLLADGHFPKEFQINSGDWMADFVTDRLKLCLITVRGGFESIQSDEAWIERMSSQAEPLPGREMEGLAFPPFYAIEDRIRRALAKAKKLLKTK